MKTTIKSYYIFLFLNLIGMPLLQSQTININDKSLVSSMENIAYLVTKSQSGNNFTDAEYYNDSHVQKAKGRYNVKLNVKWKDTRTGQQLSVAGTVIFDANHCNRQFNISSNSPGINSEAVPYDLGCLSDHGTQNGMRPGRSFRRVIRTARQN